LQVAVYEATGGEHITSSVVRSRPSSAATSNISRWRPAISAARARVISSRRLRATAEGCALATTRRYSTAAHYAPRCYPHDMDNTSSAGMPFWVANWPELRYAWKHDPAWQSAATVASRAVSDDVARVALKQQAKRLYAAETRRRLAELQELQHLEENGT
jgi:hypothetical protein